MMGASMCYLACLVSLRASAVNFQNSAIKLARGYCLAEILSK